MTARTPTYLKGRYETGDIPQGTDYEDLLDSYLNLVVSAEQSIDSNLRTTKQLVADSVSANSITCSALSVTNLSFNGLVSAANIRANTVSAGTIYADSGKITIISADTIRASSAVLDLITGPSGLTFNTGGNINASATNNLTLNGGGSMAFNSGSGYSVSAQSIVLNSNGGFTVSAAGAVTLNSDSSITLNADSNVIVSATGSILLNSLVIASSMRVTNTVSADNINVSGHVVWGAADVSATGVTQGTAFLCNNTLTFVIGADGSNTGLRLPPSERGREQVIINASTTVLRIYPAVSGRFLVTAVNAPLNLPADKSAVLYHKGDERYGILIGS